MAGKMNQAFFDEKRGAAADEAAACVRKAAEACALIGAVNYDLPDLVPPEAVHEALMLVVRSAQIARYEFEKARWAAASTTATLGEWLRQNNCEDLVRFGD
jgi:hypothetical protein